MLFITKGGGGGAATSQGGAVWNPGAAPGDGYVTTWAEVMTAFAEVPTGQYVVYLDDAGGGTFDIPAGTYELDSRLAFARPAPAVGQLTVSLADGAILRNLAGVYRNITVETNATATTALQFDDGRALELDLGAVLDNRGTQPAIVVVAGETIALGFYRASRAEATTAAIVDLEAGSTLTATFQSGSRASTDWASGTPTSTLIYLADSTYDDVTLSAAPGTVTTTRTASYANIGGTPPEPGWSTLWETDFTTMAPVDLLADGAHTLAPNVAGVAIDWTAGNGAALTERAIVAGVGLRFTTTAVSRNITTTDRDAGYLSAPLTQLAPNLDLFRATFRISAVIVSATVNSPNLFDGFYAGVWTGVASGGISYLGGRSIDGFGVKVFRARAIGAQNDLGLPNSLQDAARDAVRIEAGIQRALISFAPYAGAWPAINVWKPTYLYQAFPGGWGYNLAASSLFTGAQDIAAVLTCTNGNSAAVKTGYIERLRIEAADAG